MERTTDSPYQSSRIIWSPSEELRLTCALSRFQGDARSQGFGGGDDYESLHSWSVREPERFWPTVAQFLALKASGSFTPLYDATPGPTPLARRWFPNVTLNVAENLLVGNESRMALVSWSENRMKRSLTVAELRGAAGGIQEHLRLIGFSAGERVFAYLPNVPEGIACLLGVASLGGVWASCGTEYQLQGMLTRAERVQPRVLVAARRFLWRGREVDLTATIQALLMAVPSITDLILVDYLSQNGQSRAEPGFDVRAGVSVVSYEALTTQQKRLDTTQLFPFSHPLYLMFSSGTTGKPKGIVHGAGGTLLEHKKEMVLHSDVRPGDRVFYQTSTSWMMWNWLVSALACEATVVMYDGDPMVEEGMVLWRLAHEEGITHFGTSAAFLGALERQGGKPGTAFPLPALRAILSTGSTLYPAQFDYIRDEIKPVWIQSISGGTDILGCFGLGCPLLPVRRGEVQCKSLGLDVQTYDADGRRITGEEGELVCCSPAPSMPLFFLDDPDGSQYRAAYFAEYPDVWRHGDLIKETPEGGLLFLGRSDATLKPSGVRVATAEIYSVLQRVTRVRQSLAVGYTAPTSTSEQIVLFVLLTEGDALDESLRGDIVRSLRGANPFYVPALILQAPDLPRTANNKLSELSIKRILRGDDPGNRSALANPESLAFFESEGRERVRVALGSSPIAQETAP